MAISKSLDRLIRVAGVAFLLVGLLANEWVITAFVAGDGEINPAIKIWYVRLFDVYSLAIGTLLLAGPGVLRRTFSYIVLGLTLALSAEIGAALAYKDEHRRDAGPLRHARASAGERQRPDRRHSGRY